MKLVESILVNNPCYTAGRKIAVKGLMLHSVGCPQPSANVFIRNWNKASYGNACVHGFIDANDGTVYQTLPWDHRGWHCGRSGNDTHIGVEMCEPATIRYTTGANFTILDKADAVAAAKRTYVAATELFAFLCKKYNLDPMKKGVIVRHLVLPNHRQDSIKLMKWLGENFASDEILVSIMSQYTPVHRASDFHEINRRTSTFEYNSVCAVLQEYGFNGYYQQKSSANVDYIPEFYDNLYYDLP